MLEMFKRVVIGGRTGKTEAAWFVLFLWCAGAAYVIRKEAAGIEMDNAYALLTVALAPVGGYFATAYGMEWHSSQSRWAARREAQSDPPPEDHAG